MAKITEDDLKSIAESEVRRAVSYMGGEVAQIRRRNLYYYMGEPIEELAAPEIDGRSSVVSTDVADTVEWMLPSLLKMFTASDDAVEFTPKAQQDDQAAKDATAYINHIFYKRNPGFQILYTWFKDALIQRLGIVKVWWKLESEEAREEYRGLTQPELMMLAKDDAVEIVQASPSVDPMGQPMMGPDGQPCIDVVVTKKVEKGRVCVENVPPEEFFVSRKSKKISDGFSAHRVRRTLSELKAAGYKNVDQITSVDGAEWGDEQTTRDLLQDNDTGRDDGDIDESMREVWLYECYLKVDYDGDGIAEWRKVVLSGEQLLENVECDGPPFVAITPIILPHRLIGLCPADQAREMQKTKTSFLRAIMDNAYLQTNGRTFAVDGQVNLDDLLTSRPGGVVRVNNPGAVGPLQDGRGDLPGAYQMLEYLEQQKENRTGFTRYSQGTDANALNKTATGVSIITNKADARQELIARTFAETGVKDLFLHILKLIKQYQDTAEVIAVNSRWLQIDPRSWSNQFNFSVNVGLGTGNKDQNAAHLSQIMQVQAQAKAAGLPMVTDQNLYNAGTKLAENLGFKQPELFFTDPAQAEQQPQGPDPEQMQQMQEEFGKLQQEVQKLTMQNQQLQLKAQQKDYDTLVQKQALEHQTQQARLTDAVSQREAQLEAEKHQLELERIVDAGVAQIKQMVTQAQGLASAGTQEAAMQADTAQGERLAQMIASMGSQIAGSLEAALSRPRTMRMQRGPDGVMMGESAVQ